MKETALLFDMDGVIADTNPYHKIALKKFFQQEGKELSDQFLEERIYGRTNKDWITEAFGEVSKEKLARYASEKEQLFRDTYRPHLKPVKGLLSFLENMRDQNFEMVIATSAPRENADFILEGLEIQHFFSTILSDRDVDNGKPDPEIYLKSASAINRKPQECLVLEDSISGVKAGKNAGSRVIGLTTTHSKEELKPYCEIIVSDFDELLAYF